MEYMIIKKTINRQSNIELLRIISMFLVLVVHANFFSLGSPNLEAFESKTFFSFAQLLFQAISIGCVNTFVLISGWFGIKPSLKGFLKFIFQCLFFLIGIYLFLTLCGLTDLSLRGILKGIAGCLLLLKWNWFIKAYICLYIVAPIINAYVETADKRNFVNFLISFFIFQTIYSWFSEAAVFFESGYSTMSFIGLYSLSRYFRLYPLKIMEKWKYAYLLIYIIIVVILTLAAYWAIMNNYNFILNKIYNYVNPLVILSSLALVLFFSKIDIKSSFINWVGASCFAVFLLHTNPNVCLQYFIPSVKYIVQTNTEYGAILYLLMFLLFIFVVAILLDQIRIFLWNKITVFIK